MTSSLPFVAAIMVKTSDMMEGERLQRFVFQQVEGGGARWRGRDSGNLAVGEA